MTRRRLTLSTTFAAIALPLATIQAQEREGVEIEATPVSGSVFMLTGRGGNMGLSIGDDGAFLVDDQFAPLTDKIVSAIAALTDQPVRFVINTHWHGDHTGGNENLGRAGAIVVAHENVRVRMSTEQFSTAFNRRTPASPEGALPVVTFTKAVTFHWNGDEINVVHVDPAHTDGDAIIHFQAANVIHMGDLYFNGRYPYIDFDAGGSIDGVITAADAVLAHANADTKIIPGHGSLSNVTELREYRDVLMTIRDRIAALIAEGKSREEVIAAKPTAQFDEKWRGSWEADQWVGMVYGSMKEGG